MSRDVKGGSLEKAVRIFSDCRQTTYAIRSIRLCTDPLPTSHHTSLFDVRGPRAQKQPTIQESRRYASMNNIYHIHYVVGNMVIFLAPIIIALIYVHQGPAAAPTPATKMTRQMAWLVYTRCNDPHPCCPITVHEDVSRWTYCERYHHVDDMWLKKVRLKSGPTNDEMKVESVQAPVIHRWLEC